MTDLLKKAREIISDPDNWTKGAIARDVDGNPVGSTYEAAVCFCSMGAVRKAWSLMPGLDQDSYYLEVEKLNRYVQTRAPGYAVAGYNDNYNRTHDEILEMFDTVIANEESQ